MFLEQKVNVHVEDSVRRRDPTIQNLARDYNKHCETMATLKRAGKAPAGATLPPTIQKGSLFKLDVDDEIWQDIGLDEETDGGSPPLWLCNDGVREGIKAMLQRDRCLEEEARLQNERLAMQEWFSEEWRTVGDAIDSTGMLSSC